MAYHKDLSDKNEIRIKEQKKQFRYYVGDKHDLERYLKIALEITYDPFDIERFQIQYVNLTKKLIDQLAVVYRTPAQRYITKNGKTDEALTEYYNNLQIENINSQDKQGHRYGKLHNTILTQVLFDERIGRIKYKNRSSYLYDVEVDPEDETRATKVSYYKYFKIKGEDQEFKVVWEGDDLLYAIDEHGNEVKLPNKTDKVNPYGKNPFAILRFEDQGDFWGEGKNDVINVNEQVNLLLTKLINRDIILGTEGTLLAINCNLNKRGTIEDDARVVRASVSDPITVDDVKDTDAPPSLTHISFDPQIEAVKSTIDWYIGYIAGLNGIKAENLLAQVKDTSDYQKIMDSVDQMELRKDDIEPCRAWEKDKFEIVKAVNNSYVGTEIGRKFGIKEIPDDVEIKIDFAEIEVHKTPADLQSQRDWEAKYGLSNPVEWLMQDNPDLTKEDAQKIIEENKKYLSTPSVKSGLLDILSRQSNQ